MVDQGGPASCDDMLQMTRPGNATVIHDPGTKPLPSGQEFLYKVKQAVLAITRMSKLELLSYYILGLNAQTRPQGGIPYH